MFCAVCFTIIPHPHFVHQHLDVPKQFNRGSKQNRLVHFAFKKPKKTKENSFFAWISVCVHPAMQQSRGITLDV